MLSHVSRYPGSSSSLSSAPHCLRVFRPKNRPHQALQLQRLSSRQATASRRRTQVAAAAAVATEVQELAQKFDIPGLVEVKEGRGGLPTVALKHACGASAEVTLFGGVITSWKQKSGDEVFYLRPDAKFDKSKPISGGVPFCFPQFGPSDKMQQHGFARNVDWAIASTSADLQPDERDPSVEIVLTDTEYTRAMWPHAFKAVYTVTLHGEELQTAFRVINTGDAPFEFTAALHTYIEVVDIESAAVKGLKGLSYLDKKLDPNNPIMVTEERDVVIFKGLVDSVYLNAGNYVELDVGNGAAVAIRYSGWEDVVVWSPGEAMPDCYRKFCCVENAKFNAPARVEAGGSWEATQQFNVVDLVG